MFYFDNLVCREDFLCEVAGLSHHVRAAFAFPSLHQLGIVVPDVEQPAPRLETEGFRPFFIARGAPVFWHENEQAFRVSGKMGLAYCRGIEIELLEPLEGSAFYHDGLDPYGRPVVRHLGFLVDDVDVWAGRLRSAGTGVWVRGRLKTGAMKTDFVYMDPIEKDGLIMEFIAWKLFGRPMKPGTRYRSHHRKVSEMDREAVSFPVTRF
jgi:hypothetical protein